MRKFNILHGIILAFLFQFYACVTPLYVPTSQGIPKVEKDEIAIQANVSVSDPSIFLVDSEVSFQMSGTYGITESTAVNFSGSLGSNYEINRKQLNGGIGYNINIDPTSYFQIYGLAGYQSQRVNNKLRGDFQEWFKSSSYLLGFQPGLYSKIGFTTIGLVASLKHINYFKIEDKNGNELLPTAQFYLDPALVFSRGRNNLSFNTELGLSNSFGEYPTAQFYASFGIAYKFKTRGKIEPY